MIRLDRTNSRIFVNCLESYGTYYNNMTGQPNKMERIPTEYGAVIIGWAVYRYRSGERAGKPVDVEVLDRTSHTFVPLLYLWGAQLEPSDIVYPNRSISRYMLISVFACCVWTAFSGNERPGEAIENPYDCLVFYCRRVEPTPRHGRDVSTAESESGNASCGHAWREVCWRSC